MSTTWCPTGPAALVTGLFAAGVLLAAPAHAQYGVDSWTTDDGLPQNIVRAVRQTRDGYLWLATLDGLVRFDGVRFAVFNRGSSPGPATSRFLCLYEAADGVLWAGSESGGLTRYEGGRFTSYTIQHGLPNQQVDGITGDDAGQLWVLSNRRILRHDADRFHPMPGDAGQAVFQVSSWDTEVFWGVNETTLYRFTRGRLNARPLPDALRGLAPTAFEEDAAGTLWLLVPGGRVARVQDDGLVTFYRVFDVREDSFKEVALHPDLRVEHRDRHGRVWPLELDGFLLRHMVLPDRRRPERVPVAALHEDREGNLWVGTEGRGLHRVRRQLVTAYSEAQGLVARNVYPVFEDRGGAIWIGAWTSGVSRYFRGRFTNYTTGDGLASGLVTAFAEDRDGRLWVAAHHERNGGLRIFRDGRFHPLPDEIVPSVARIAVIHHAADGAVWLGTTHGLVRYRHGITTTYTVDDGLAGNDVRVIVAGEGDDLWVGSSGGLTHVAHGHFTRWTEHDGLPSNDVRALYRDPEGVLWIGTYDGGLGRLKDGRLAKATTGDGLFNNGVFQVLEDAGFLWMCSNRGVHRVSKHELNEFADGRLNSIHAMSLGTSDGMFSAECNGGYWPAGVKTRDGALWFPTQDGVVVINPRETAGNAIPPPVAIESALVDRAPASLGQGVRMGPGSHQLEIQYSGLSLVNSDRIRFRYRLAGLDRDWVEAGYRRVAYYSGLPPGEYTFTVIAANGDGVWNTVGARLAVTVVPPFWRTAWFIVAVGLGVAGIAAFGYRRRVGALERAQSAQAAFSRRLIELQEGERKRIAAELHDSLGQNLLIIKNRAALGAAASPAADAARAEFDEIGASAARAVEEVRQIAYDLRPYHLDRLGLTSSIEEMIDRVANSSGIRFWTTIASIDGLVAKELEINLYRIVQESVNNVVRHSKAREAWVEITRDASEVRITVRDNGRGFWPETAATAAGERPSFGLAGIAERVQMLGGSHAVRSVPGQGTTITVTLPARTH
jgi:signal transduction histidine kinase/ligand-binding sensor domain-containing protein